MSLQQSLHNSLKHPNQTDVTEGDQFLASFLNQSCKNIEGHLSYTKENTHEGTLEEVKKQIAQSKKQQTKLKGEFQSVKSALIQTCLKQLLSQLNFLSKENQELRAEYKKATKNSVRQSSPLQTPRARKSVNTVMSRKSKNAQSKISEYKFNSSSKKQKENIERISFQPKTKIQQSQVSCIQQFFHGVANFGRNSLPNQRPILGKKPHQKQNYDNNGNLRCMNWQNTERKPMLSISQSKNLQNSFSLSQIFVPQNNSSYDSQSRVVCQSFNQQITIDCNSPNIFLEFINTIVEQQKQMQKQIMQDINMGVNYEMACKSSVHDNQKIKMINEMLSQVKSTQQRIQKLESLYKNYQADIRFINGDISTVNYNIAIVAKQKEKDMIAFNEVKRKSKLFKEFKQKESYYKYLMEQKKSNRNQLPQSLKEMMKILSGRSTQQPNKCVQIIRDSIRNPRKFKLQRKNKQDKLKVLMGSIEQGRKKFTQLLQIYNVRIRKLEEKIGRQIKNSEGVSKTHR